MTMQNFDNPFLRFLEEDPLGRRAALFAQPGVSGGGYQSQHFFANLFPQVENRFLGALGQQIQSGQAPTLSFTDFLQNNFNPRAELLKAPAYQTGQGTSGLVSPARFLTAF